jgi:Na+/H+-dicarboxylate symporter
MLLATVAIAYLDTLLAGMLAYGTGVVAFPKIITSAMKSGAGGGSDEIAPFFTVNIPAMCDVMSALVFAFLVGLGIAYGKKAETLKSAASEFRDLVEKAIAKAIIPLLPVYIFGIFLAMTANGSAFRMLFAFAKVIAVIFALHIVILLYEFVIAGTLARRNPVKLLWTMLPAYMTALGTSSSAATIPVTLAQTKKNGVPDEIAGFTVPLCATIHLSGSMMKITACALAICMMEGIPYGADRFMEFIALLGIMMVAAPGVPGGAIMAALAPLGTVLGFSAENQALMIALYIAMDSFGTACNVTGDGAIAIVVQRMFANRKNPANSQ